jgi:hypothetical protein
MLALVLEQREVSFRVISAPMDKLVELRNGFVTRLAEHAMRSGDSV